MRKLLYLTPLLLQGCFFVYIPGSVVSAASDAITGAEGNNCVGANARAGDRIRTPGGGWATVKSLSGTSVRCTNPELPIRALLAFDTTYSATDPRTTAQHTTFTPTTAKSSYEWNKACTQDSDCSGPGAVCTFNKEAGESRCQ